MTRSGTFMRQAEASGMGDAQLEQMAQARGMRPEEAKKLRERVDKLKKDDKQTVFRVRS